MDTQSAITNPVKISIPNNTKNIKFSIFKNAALGQKVDIAIFSIDYGRVNNIQNFSMEANPHPCDPISYNPPSNELTIDITGYYHFHSDGYKLSPGGKILSTNSDGTIIMVGFDDNGVDDHGGDGDYNDIRVEIQTTARE